MLIYKVFFLLDGWFVEKIYSLMSSIFYLTNKKLSKKYNSRCERFPSNFFLFNLTNNFALSLSFCASLYFRLLNYLISLSFFPQNSKFYSNCICCSLSLSLNSLSLSLNFLSILLTFCRFYCPFFSL